jgi:myo-inositol-1(or 4)-monophosphatase
VKESVVWIIDPIDGTKSFLRGVPLYGVLIGLEIDGQIKVGAAYFPGTDEMLCAAEGLGAWWNGRRAHVSEISSLDRAFICYTNERNMYRHNRGEAWKRLNEAAYASRGWSDAYGYLCVATGRAEAMLDPIMNIWDCGPFPVIFKEAGGYFGSWDGREGHTHNEALACNATIKDEILRLING